MSRSNDIANITASVLDGVTATEVGLGNVDNTSDANKPVSTAQQSAIDLKANIASPTFTGNVALGSNASGTFNGTIGASADFPAGHVVGMKAVTLENTTISTALSNYQPVSQLDLSINRTSGTHLLYFLQGGGGFTASSAHSIYIMIRRTDGTSYGSTNETDLSGADTHGHSRLYANVASILVPYSVMAFDNASVSGNKTYRTFYKSGASGESVTFQDNDRAMITASIIEFIPTT